MDLKKPHVQGGGSANIVLPLQAAALLPDVHTHAQMPAQRHVQTHAAPATKALPEEHNILHQIKAGDTRLCAPNKHVLIDTPMRQSILSGFGRFWNKVSRGFVVPADEYLQAAECLRGLTEFSQGQQGSGFPGFVQQCRDQGAALQEVGSPHTRSPCLFCTL